MPTSSPITATSFPLAACAIIYSTYRNSASVRKSVPIFKAVVFNLSSCEEQNEHIDILARDIRKTRN